MDIFRFSTLLVISSLPFARCDCPGNFPYQFGCSCYQIVSSFALSKDRSDATVDCVSQSSHLVFIESEEESDYLANEYDTSNFYWIGLNGREFEDKTWDDGSPAEHFRFVDYTEPFGDDSGCYKVVPSGYNVPADTWHDHVCWDDLGYICETEDTSCTTTTEEITTRESTTPRTTPEPTTIRPSTAESTTDQPSTPKPSTSQPTTLQPSTLQPSTIQPSTLQPSTIQPSTLQPSTIQPSTLQPSTTAVITTEEVLTTEEGVIDVGSFFGIPSSGIYIPGDSVHRSRGTVTTASRCGLLCPPLMCRAFMYIEDENICHLAISPSNSFNGQIYSKIMRCSRVGGKLLCT